MKKDLSKRPVRARRKKTMNSFYYNSDYSNDLNSEESKGRMSFLKRGEASDEYETSGTSKTKEQRKYHDMYNHNQRVGNNPMMNDLRVNSMISHENKKNEFFDDSNNLKDSSDNEKRIRIKNHRAQNEEILNIKNEEKMEHNGNNNSLKADKGKSYNPGANGSSKANCNRAKHLSNSSENNYAKMAEKLPHVVGVRFDKSQNRWLSGICINGRCINRYFPVYKYGFEEARRLAIQHRKNFETANLGHLKKQQGESKTSHLNLLNINSQIPNGFKDIHGKNKLIFKYLSYDSIQKEWVVTYDYDNKVLVNKFPVDIYGYNNAYEMAVQCINRLTVCNQEKMCKNVNQDASQNVNQDASQSLNQSANQSANQSVGANAGPIAKMFKGENMKGLIASENDLSEQSGVVSASLAQRKEKTNKLFNLANKLLTTPIDSEEMNGLISHHENNMYNGGSKHFLGGEYNNNTYSSEYLSDKKQKVGQSDSDVGNPRSDKTPHPNEYNNFYKNETSFLGNDFHYFNNAIKQLNSTNNANDSSSSHFKPDSYNESSYAAVNGSSFPLVEDDGIIGSVFDSHKNILTSGGSNMPGKDINDGNEQSDLAYLSSMKRNSDDNSAKLLHLLNTSLISEEDQNTYHLLNNVLKHSNVNNKSIESGSTTVNHTLDEEESEKRAIGVVKWNHLIKSQEYQAINNNGQYSSNNNMNNMNNACSSSRKKENPFQGSTNEGITNPQILEAFLKLSSEKDGPLDSSINLDENDQQREDKHVRNESRHYGEDTGEGSHGDQNDLTNRVEKNRAFGQYFHGERETEGSVHANDDEENFQNEVEKKSKMNEHLNYENLLNFNKMIRNLMNKNNNNNSYNDEKIIKGMNTLINMTTTPVGDKTDENVTDQNRDNEQRSYGASTMNELQGVVKRHVEASINYEDYITVKDEQDDDAMNEEEEQGEDATPLMDPESENQVQSAQNDVAVCHTSSNGDVVTNQPGSEEEEKPNGENSPHEDTQKEVEEECPEKNVENIIDQNAENSNAPNDAVTTTQEDNPTEANQLEEKKTKQNNECNEIAMTLYPWKKGIQWNEQKNMWVCKLWDESGNEITKHVYVKNKEGVEIGYNYCSKLRMNSFDFYLSSELKKFPPIEEISYDLQNLCFVVDYKDEEKKRYSFEGGICRAFEDAVEYLNKRKGEENNAAENVEEGGEELDSGGDRADGEKQNAEEDQEEGDSQVDMNKETDENSQTDLNNQTNLNNQTDGNHDPHNIADFVQDERNHAQLDDTFKELNYFECRQKLPSSNTCEQTKLAYSLKPWVKGIIWEEKMKKWVVFFKDINKNLRISFFNPCDYNNDVILSYKKCCEYFLQIKKSNNFDENEEDFSESIRDFIKNFEFENTTGEHHPNEGNNEGDENDDEGGAGADLIKANQSKSLDYYSKDKDHMNFGDYNQVNSSYLSKISEMLLSMRKQNNNRNGNEQYDDELNEEDQDDAASMQQFPNGGKTAEKRKFNLMNNANDSNNLSYADARKLIKLELPNDEVLHSSQNGNDLKGNNAMALLQAYKYAADLADRKGNGKGDLLFMQNSEFFNQINHSNLVDNEKTRKRKKGNKRAFGKGKHGIGENADNAAAGSDNTESDDENDRNDANRNSNSGRTVRKGLLVESKKYFDLQESGHLLNGSNDYLLNDEDGSYKMDYSGSERQKKANLTNEYGYNITSSTHNNNSNTYQEDGTAIAGRGIKNEANYDSNFLGGNNIDSNSDIMMNGNNANSNHINLLKQQQGVVAGADIAAMLEYVRNNADNGTTTTMNTDLTHSNNNGKGGALRNYEKYTSNMDNRSINKTNEKLDSLIENNINVRLPKSEILNQAASLPKLQGMFFDKRRNYWTVSVCGFRKSFGVRTRGVYQAYKMAAEFRNRILETNKGKCYPQKSSSMSSNYKYNLKNANNNGLIKDEKGSFALESAVPNMEDENFKKKTMSLCNMGNGNNDKDLLPGGDPRGVAGMGSGAFGSKGNNNLGFVTSNIYDYLWDKKSNGMAGVSASNCSAVCGAVCTGMCTAIGGSTICSGACGGICSGNCSGGKKDVTNNSTTNSVSYDENFTNLEDDKTNLNGKTNKYIGEKRLRGNYIPSKNENGIMSMMTDSNLMQLLNEGTGAEALLRDNKTGQLKKLNGHNVSSSNSAISNNGGNPTNYSPTHIYEVDNNNGNQDYYLKGEDGKTDLNKSEDYKNGKSNSSSNHVSPSMNLIKAAMNMNSDDGSKTGNVSFAGLDSDDAPNNNLHKISTTFGEQLSHEEPYGKNVTHNDYDVHTQNSKAMTEVELLNKLISHNIDENLCLSFSNNMPYSGDENYEQGKEDLYKTYNFDGDNKSFNFGSLLDETVEERDIRINKEVHKCKFVEGLIYDEANKCFRIKINGYRKAYSVIRRGVKEAYKLSIAAIQQIRGQAHIGALSGLNIGLNGNSPSSGNLVGGKLNNTSEQGQINSNNLTHLYNSSPENSKHGPLYNYHQYKNKQETQNDFADGMFEKAPDVNNNESTQVDSNRDDSLGETKKVPRENNNAFPTLNIDDKYYELLKTAIIICLNDILMNSIPKLFHLYKNISSTTNVKIEDVLNTEKKKKEQSIKYHIEYTQNSIGVSSLIPYLRLFSMEILNNVLPSTQSLEIQRQIIHSLDLQTYNTSY
ncbi:Malaria antigen [Plasmodium coatneyi]|uniref:Malaria antigen n=1 Tax=Plasmodium coatneyi TaxID=208452 RepID=A0A1B1E062_9APIC|nr:Malaria antigen [Plasmodium coatneyi]ANQ08237.1 Malaria antigen [Plasmodium coatneyi]